MAKAIELRFHGAARTVTGSCMEVRLGSMRLLVDCGLFQGTRTLEALNYRPFAFEPRTIDAVLLTHAHIDHSGLLPRLVAEGFAGPIYCTEPTRGLLAYVLPDSARIQEWDAEYRNQRADRRGESPIAPLYRAVDADRALELLRPIALNQWFEPAPGLRARLWNAGHILGSASIELQAGGTSILFSGDLGPAHKSFEAPPEAPAGVDHVVCESTYGDRDREDISIAERQTLLETEIREALARKGNLVIPIFAVERTQELLFDIAVLFNSGRLPRRPVFIDSPLASRTTSVFAAHKDELEGIGTQAVFDNTAFHYVEDVSESIRLNATTGAIIMAASGMCEGGRIRHHLLHNLARSDSTVLFVGYQAQGTLGRTILDGAPRVRISGRDVTIRARIRRMDFYSAHADRGSLLDWIGARHPVRGTLFLDHGEPSAIESLRATLDEKGVPVIVPSLGETYQLEAGTKAQRLTTGDAALTDALQSDWQNDYAKLAVNLKHELQAIEGEKVRRAAIADMRAVLERYRGHREHERRSHPPRG